MLDNEFINNMKNVLLEQKEEVTSQIKKDLGLDVDADGDETDEIQGKLILAINKQFCRRNQEKLTKINEALEKIEKHQYGSCEDCGEDLLDKRLLINPYFTTCIICAELREKEQKQRKKDIP